MRCFGLRLAVMVCCILPASLCWALELTFVHTSDIHAHYESFDENYEFCGFENGLGGSARIGAFIETARAQYANVIVVDTGDQFNKSPYFAKYGAPLVNANLKALRYDVVSLGNHEFMQGARGFRQLLKNLDIPVLCANLNYGRYDWLGKQIKPWLVMEVEGRQVGFVGAVAGPEDARLKPLKIDAYEPREYVENAVAELTAQGVDIIVLLSHCGYQADLELARAVAGLDVILGGHSHVLFANDNSEADVSGYPVVINNGRQNVLLAHSGYYGKYVGLLQVTFNSAGEPVAWSGDSVPMDERIKPSMRVAALFMPYKEMLDTKRDVEVGYSAVFLDGGDRAMRFGESLFGNLVADTMLEQGKPYGAQAALFNAGSITGNINVGDVSAGDLKNALLYNNWLVLVDILGADLQEALEYGLAAANEPLAERTGRFLQVAGLRLEADLSRPAGCRINAVWVADGVDFTPLEPDKVYKIVTNDFMAKGGDDNAAFLNGVRATRNLNLQMLDMVTEHFEKCSPVNPVLDGRIILLNQTVQ